METKRVSVPADLQARIKYNCRNRCALCAALNNDYSEKQGQIAHIDHNCETVLEFGVGSFCLLF